MSYALVEEEKFDKRVDFALWKVKIRARLGILGLTEALKIEEQDGNKYVKIAEDEKLSSVLSPDLEEKNRKARSVIILGVGDKILRKIMKEETASGMLKVLEKLFTATSLARRIYLKQKLRRFRMNENKSIEENISELQSLIDELSNAKVSMSDEDQAIVLLQSLPKQYDGLRDILMYGRTSITLDEVTRAVLCKELELGKANGRYKKKYREKTKTRIGVEKFDGKGDYTLWKTRMLAHFEILGWMGALKIEEEDGHKSFGISEDKRHFAVFSLGLEGVKRKARSLIMESVEDQELRKRIMKEDTAGGMFQVLDKLCMSSSSTNRTYLKLKLCQFRMDESQSIEANIDEFQRLVDDLSNAKVSMSDEDQAIRLLISFPERFDHLTDVLTYSRTSLTLDEVIYSVLSKELEFDSAYRGFKDTAEGFHLRGRSVRRDQNAGNNKYRDRSKSKEKKGVCYKNRCPSKEHT